MRGPRWALRLELGDYKARTSSRLFYCTFFNALLCMHVIFHDKVIYKNKSQWMSVDAQGERSKTAGEAAVGAQPVPGRQVQEESW